jgi:phosphoesterase RecJ-like protein
MEKYKAIVEAIKSAHNIVISSHKSPDGDSIGSSLALFYFIESLGKKSVICHADRAAPNLTWVEGAESILTFEENPESVTQYFQNADLILCLDYNAIDRVGPEIAPLLADSTALKIMIDHHLYPAEFCAITVSEPTVCSAAQLIYELIDQSGNLDLLHVKMATPIYLGIMTDTGSFRFSSVEPRTHEIIAQLLKVGVNQADIHEKVFDTNTIERLQLRGHVVSENLEILPDYPVAILSVSENDLIRFGYKKGDTDGLVNVALSIQGVKIAAFFAEKDGKVKISFRSKGEYFVNSLAMDNFDGGGHKYAAGGISSLSLEETISRFKSLLSTYY